MNQDQLEIRNNKITIFAAKILTKTSTTSHKTVSLKSAINFKVVLTGGGGWRQWLQCRDGSGDSHIINKKYFVTVEFERCVGDELV
ncbi:hypothetical protein B9Z55_023443 [Caenorhabditis nigoni]|uniref:Uncharacterized protein n=1 Tax=Caenorhabditis nigoni TaxID=1611254 RepID=A0A2G5SPZ4_9PELO|nr:hypothetical protein B9Z55_023443 [Caenorhabditis nigoni]